MPVKNYYSRNGQIEFEAVGSNVITYGRDMLGNVVAGYDNATNAVFTANYKPYGEFAQTTGNISGQRFMYCGAWGYRFQSGVPCSHYVRLMHLLMRMGRWGSGAIVAGVTYTQPSPGGAGGRRGRPSAPPGSPNYGGGNPGSYVEPFGGGGSGLIRPVGPPSGGGTVPAPGWWGGHTTGFDECASFMVPIWGYVAIGVKFCVKYYDTSECCAPAATMCYSVSPSVSAGISIPQLNKLSQQVQQAVSVIGGLLSMVANFSIQMNAKEKGCPQPMESTSIKSCISACVGVASAEACFNFNTGQFTTQSVAGACVPGAEIILSGEYKSCR